MEEAKSMAQQQQQQQQQQQHLLFQQQQQQQRQQQFMLLQQQLQKQQHLHQQSSAISRFPSNIDAHLRPLRPPAPPTPPTPSSSSPNPNPNPNSNPNPNPNNAPSQLHHQRPPPSAASASASPAARGTNHTEVQMAYQDAWRVSHPDFKRPFSSLLDACERLLPYHVVADYEAEEDDRILDSDTTGQMPSRSQQWDHNIAAKVAEFTGTFEKQALAFNIISRKRAHGEFRSEERLMIEQAMCQEEKRAHLELKAELESREKRMAALEQARATAEMMSRAAAGPIRASALGAADMPMAHHHHHQQQHNHNHNNHLGETDEMVYGWGQRDEKEPSEDFLNDEETDNGETSGQDGWHETGEFDLNTR